MDIVSPQKVIGDVDALIEYADGRPAEKLAFRNTVLQTGRQALAYSLAFEIGAEFSFYINRMIFGDGGTTGGVPKFVDAGRNGLFGITRASKPVIATVDPTFTTQATFTSVLTFQDANGFVLSEMALQLATGDLYSMTTFPDLSKTPLMQITWNWRLSFV